MRSNVVWMIRYASLIECDDLHAHTHTQTARIQQCVVLLHLILRTTYGVYLVLVDRLCHQLTNHHWAPVRLHAVLQLGMVNDLDVALRYAKYRSTVSALESACYANNTTNCHTALIPCHQLLGTNLAQTLCASMSRTDQAIATHCVATSTCASTYDHCHSIDTANTQRASLVSTI
jgi:hypothetical protein